MSALNKKTVYTDLIALLVFGAVFTCVFFAQQLGLGLVDEQFYHTIVKRLLQGDRLFVDEWHLSQLIGVLLILPCRLYLRVFGSAEGLILAMRRLYLVCTVLFGGYVYIRLKKYGFTALFFALAVCLFFPYYTFTYYTVAVNGMVFILVTLFASDKKPKAPVLVLLGAAAAVTVVAEPILAVGYFLYTAQALTLFVLKKKGRAKERTRAIRPTLRGWGFITAGIAAVFAVFLIWLLSSYGWSLRPLLRDLPELFNGAEYTFRTDSAHNNVYRLGIKLGDMLRLFGYAPPVLTCAAVLGAWAVKRFRPDWLRRPLCRSVLFLLLCGLLAASYVCAWRFAVVQRQYSESRVDNIVLHGGFLPVFLFAWGCYPLLKDPPPLYFALLQTGAFASVLVDLSSDFCMCYGGVITLLPAMAGAKALIAECFPLRRKNGDGAQTPQKKTDAAAVLRVSARSAAAAVSAVCVLYWAGSAFVHCALLPAAGYLRGDRGGVQMAVIETGPFRGIRTTAEMKEICSATERDMAAAALLGSGPLYVDSFCPMPYLYAENPMGIYSSFYLEEERPTRVPLYWERHPEKTPELIYIPYYEYVQCGYFERLYVKNLADSMGSQTFSAKHFYDKRLQKEKIPFFETYFRFEITEGEAGYILHVTDRVDNGGK